MAVFPLIPADELIAAGRLDWVKAKCRGLGGYQYGQFNEKPVMIPFRPAGNSATAELALVNVYDVSKPDENKRHTVVIGSLLNPNYDGFFVSCGYSYGTAGFSQKILADMTVAALTKAPETLWNRASMQQIAAQFCANHASFGPNSKCNHWSLYLQENPLANAGLCKHACLALQHKNFEHDIRAIQELREQRLTIPSGKKDLFSANEIEQLVKLTIAQSYQFPSQAGWIAKDSATTIPYWTGTAIPSSTAAAVTPAATPISPSAAIPQPATPPKSAPKTPAIIDHELTETLRVLAGAPSKDGHFLLITGPHGAGKTVNVRNFCETNPNYDEYIEVQCYNDREISDLVGRYMRTPAGFEFAYGLVGYAAKRAASGSKVVLCFEEMFRSNASTMASLMTFLSPDRDGNLRLNTDRIVQKNGLNVAETIDVPMENITIVATTNKGSQYDVNHYDPAFLERWIDIPFVPSQKYVNAVLDAKMKSLGLNPHHRGVVTQFAENIDALSKNNELQAGAQFPLRSMNQAVSIAHKYKASGTLEPEAIKKGLKAVSMRLVGTTAQGLPNTDHVTAITKATDKAANSIKQLR